MFIISKNELLHPPIFSVVLLVPISFISPLIFTISFFLPTLGFVFSSLSFLVPFGLRLDCLLEIFVCF